MQLTVCFTSPFHVITFVLMLLAFLLASHKPAQCLRANKKTSALLAKLKTDVFSGRKTFFIMTYPGECNKSYVRINFVHDLMLLEDDERCFKPRLYLLVPLDLSLESKESCLYFSPSFSPTLSSYLGGAPAIVPGSWTQFP